MLHPQSSVLVVVDAAAAISSTTSPSIASLKTLLVAADLLGIPTIATCYPVTAVPVHLGNTGSVGAPILNIPFDPAASDWAATNLGRAIAETERSQMIVSGFWLEEAITMLCLKGLSTGVDTYVPVNAAPAITPKFARTALARLTQAGAVPTTTDQILREWSALSADGNVQSKLIGMLK
jgi:hypothetical protein